MSHTPSTDEVRNAWVQVEGLREAAHSREVTPDVYGAEFNRWLAGELEKKLGSDFFNELLVEARAEAWDEGALEAGTRLCVTQGGMEGFTASLTNPYREAAGGTVA